MQAKLFAKIWIYMVIVGLFCSMGGHELIIQTYAWTKMTIHFSKTDKVYVAVQKTFDGRHLCPICLALNAKKAAQPKFNLNSFRPRLEVFELSLGLINTNAYSQKLSFSFFDFPMHDHVPNAPPSPPPKLS